jgi:nicotinamidase/pyrazinamidase
VNELAADSRFELVVATRDWHPADHGSFEERGGPWPVHCVQGTEGAELHPSLESERVDVVIDKGTDPGTEGYSGFEGTALGELLRERGIDRVTVVGLATDYCVKNTALDALRQGLDVTVDSEGVRGVDVADGDSERALDELRSAGATVT